MSSASARHGAGWALLACSAAIALSSCSAGQADSPEPEPIQPPASAAGVETEAEMAEPLVPKTERDSISASGRIAISEKGNGTGTYTVEGGLKPGDVISISASCVPGEEIAISNDQGSMSFTTSCSNPASGWTTFPPATAAVPEFTITVETADGAPYWLMAWVYRGT